MKADEPFVLHPVWVVIPNQNGMRWLPECLGTLFATTPPEATVCVVDNASTDGSQAYIREKHPEVKLLELSSNLGFVQATNLGVLAAQRDGAAAVMLLNNDTRVAGEWFATLRAVASANPQYSILGPIQNDFNGNPSPRTAAILKDAPTPLPEIQPTDWVEGSCMWINTEVFERIGYLDPLFAPAYFEEIDFCRRARRAGFKIGLATASGIQHFGAGTSLHDAARSRQRILNERNYLLYHAAASTRGVAYAARTLVVKAAVHGAKLWSRGELSLREWFHALSGIPARLRGLAAKVRRDSANRPCPILGDASPCTLEQRYYAACVGRMQAGGLPSNV